MFHSISFRREDYNEDDVHYYIGGDDMSYVSSAIRHWSDITTKLFETNDIKGCNWSC